MAACPGHVLTVKGYCRTKGLGQNLQEIKQSQAAMALWNGVGQVASIAQLAGVDAYGLISMIVEAANTVKRNRETCQLLARRVRMIGSLLQQLQSCQLMQHTETRDPMEQLEETLRHAYMLIASCRDSTYLHSCFMGAKLAEQLREVQNEITFYLQLFPLVSFVDATRNLERIRNTDHPSCSEVPANGLHEVHHSKCDDRLRTKDPEPEGIEFNPRKSGGERTEGQVMVMGEHANLIVGGKVMGIFHFSFSKIADATEKISQRNLIGEGGFGNVYKGKLPGGLDIAVKRHNTSSAIQSPEQFRAEIETIPYLRHKHIITLIGCCIQQGENILIYEYMPNKCLGSILRDETKREMLKWIKRLQIIKAVADGIAYLHGHSHMCIVHRDIKPSNILLDHEMNPKITDFGLAIRLAPNTDAEETVMGTYGYADPCYVATGKVSHKSDVWSFGVVLLEIISGKPVLNKMKADDKPPSVHLPDYARQHRHRRQAKKLIDPLLDAKRHERAQIMECIKVALLCIHNLPENRPAMSEVVTMLDCIQTMRP